MTCMQDELHADKRPVAIVGFAASSREAANHLAPNVEIWGENHLYRSGFLKRADRWFELHSRRLYETTLDARRPGDYVEWLSQFPGPVYMLEPQPDIPNSVRYPIEAVIADVGEYLTSSVAYMLGLAILEKRPEIHLYGVDMAMGTEYAEQRACCEYLIGLARGRGVKIVLPEQSPLLTGPLYGRGGERISDNQFARRLQALEKRKGELQKQQAEIVAHLNVIEGSILETNFWMHATPEGNGATTLATTLQHTTILANGHVPSTTQEVTRS